MSSRILTIADPTILDGYTQPGAHPNTNPLGIASNAVFQINLVGGLRIISTNSTVRGLVIRFGGIDISCGLPPGLPPRPFECASNTRIEGNFIGTDNTGTRALNAGGGIGISGALATAPGMLISNNTLVGNIIVGGINIANSPNNT